MFLGIDLGTSEVKVLLVDDAGRVAGAAGAPLEVSRPHPRWSEQAPEDWWRATVAAVQRLRDAHPAAVAAVRGIGLSGQMHGATLLDAVDRPLRPAILWNDTRSDRECRELLERAPATLEITGNRAMPGFTAPKLLWVARHEPELFARVASVLLPKDYVRLRLTGEKVSDPSDASGTLWLDVARRDWSDVMLAATGLSRAHMPRLVEGSAPSGRLLPAVAATLGIAGTPVVAGGGGDNAASAVGIGAISPGDGFLSLGTSGVLFVVNDRFLPAPARAVHAFCHALPARWHQMSVMLSAASCLRWLSRLLGIGEADLVAEVEGLDAAARARAPIFLPYLSGERTPHDDAAATGVFHGLTHDTDRRALVYAVLEGVAFGLADGLAALQEAGARVEALSVVGGGARSGVWTQLIADVLDVRLETPEGGERGAALGAARLAQIACGAPEAAVCGRPPVARAHVPSPASATLLANRRDRFRRLYPAVAPLWPPAA
ncbi:xylulokinase [Anaeromyxobacter oryzae]|uniref:Xylulose kinase n=1 Tax=Anaeromyxobacter oryzae TaxID=2918170 RepID=A0ABM7WQ87_9BACT|nr:xylulokinase [Anaeromyxobacter oryzae]BDG01627.1 xylulokinase [Anaeromyxobacter oryzae]